ncbi:DEAD/DEAH box helicase family protein [Pantoea sp. S62]|uniref:DEAD/DEAH box helicase family protein n=1 Tax=Pantoea sp. S62 TaxID=2769342 RepID=UPI001913D3FD|nr:DEAD/DEAH box helicase family protein [Pantoea sp. S62]MBK5013981.1 DEAD/DEAH box helicase family protein [Pantoea sp. S62]
MFTEELQLPKLLSREELKKESDKLRAAVLSGEVQDKLLMAVLRKEMTGSESAYNGEWTLEQNRWINSIIDEMDLSSGVNLINSSVGTGKTTQFIYKPTEEERQRGMVTRAKTGYIVLVPLTSIRLSFEGDNDLFKTGICTWNQIDTILRHPNKEYFADKTLVIDEVHGFFLDYGYKANVINRLITSFNLFKSVIMLSGTASPDDFSGIDFNKVYKVYKPSLARKTLNTVIATKTQDLVLTHLNQSKRKTIVLLNDKAQCEALNQMCTRSGLVVNADRKDNQDVMDLYTSGIMKTDILYGTYSIVEGLSINNVLDEVDVIIVGHEHPARIEQFTNRFRNVSKLKCVTYYLNRSEIEEVGIFNRNEVVSDAKVMKELLQVTYETLQTDEAKYSFTSQYRKDIAGSMVYFHNGEFHVSFTGIDYAYSEHKIREYANNCDMLCTELKKYDFVINPMRFEDGDGDTAKVITDTAKKLKEAAVEAENAIILEYLDDALSGNVKAVEDATELYTSIDESASKLLARGLKSEDFKSLIEGYVEDRSFFARAHADADYYPNGNTIRELIITKLAGKTKLDSFDIGDIADSIISKVHQEYFAGNDELMLKHPLWKKSVSVVGGQMVSSSSKGAKSIVERYITLSKGKQERVNGQKVRLCEVVHLSLTGLQFRPPVFRPKAVEHVEVSQTLEGLKARFNKLFS